MKHRLGLGDYQDTVYNSADICAACWLNSTTSFFGTFQYTIAPMGQLENMEMQEQKRQWKQEGHLKQKSKLGYSPQCDHSLVAAYKSLAMQD